MTDYLKVVFWVGLCAMLIATCCIVAVALANTASQNLALAVSTLAGATVLFCMQVVYELTTKSKADTFSAELTIDRATPSISRWSTPSDLSRWQVEDEANTRLLDKTAFDGDRERLTSDFVIYSFIAFLRFDQPDWQQERTVLRGANAGVLVRTHRASGQHECTPLNDDQIRATLTSAGNTFGHLQPLVVHGQQLCLPPDTTLHVAGRTVELRTPFSLFKLTVEPSSLVSYVKPGLLDVMSSPLLKNGESQYETRLVGLRAEVEYSWVRANHRDMKKYVEWNERLLKGARKWWSQEGVEGGA